MSSTISVYGKGVTVENLSGDELYDKDGDVQVTINDVDASDFVSEFTVDEILSAMDFSDVFDWAIKMNGEDDE